MEEKKVMEIPIDSIVPNPYQPRKSIFTIGIRRVE